MIPKILNLSKGPGGVRTDLKNGQPFVCYIERNKTGRNFYAVGVEGKDFGYVTKDAVVFAFYNDSIPIDAPLDDSKWGSTRLCRAVRRVGGFDYSSTGQRKGQEYYWAHDFEWRFQGIKAFDYNASDKGYRVRPDIANKGDAWISEDEVTGSIRMRDNESSRAILYFVTFTDNYENPLNFGNNYSTYTKADLSK